MVNGSSESYALGSMSAPKLSGKPWLGAQSPERGRHPEIEEQKTQPLLTGIEKQADRLSRLIRTNLFYSVRVTLQTGATKRLINSFILRRNANLSRQSRFLKRIRGYTHPENIQKLP
jgi:hypothetical protein